MPIQFYCPYCTAAIRVSDAAAGNRGRCPKCETEVLVPRVAPPPSGNRSAEPPPAVSAPADVPIVTDAPTPIAARVRRRRPSSALGWVVPLFLGAALVGVGVWLFVQSQPRLEGELVGEALQVFEIPSQSVPQELIEIDAATRELVLEGLEQEPERLVTPGVLIVEFRGSERGILVSVEPAETLQLVRLRPGGDPRLVRFRKEHSEQLDAPRRRELVAAARQFCLDWQRAHDAGLPMDASGYLERLGLNAMVGGLGYHTRAIAGRKIYPCVYEDVDGALYFILPRGTRAFRLEGRKLGDGSVVFPGNYTVRISAR